MKKATMGIELNNRELEKRLESLVKWINIWDTKELINTYYSLSAQRLINDKKYEKLATLEWLLDLFSIIDSIQNKG